jgi:DNA-directed RNA polymerase subunit RPC12/RpoP
MTREEAIELLQETKSWHLKAVCEALDMAIEALQAQEPRGVYQCFHCGSQSVVWQSDFSFEDYGLDGEGIINVCHCTNCGAHIEYYINLEEDDENEREETI